MTARESLARYLIGIAIIAALNMACWPVAVFLQWPYWLWGNDLYSAAHSSIVYFYLVSVLNYAVIFSPLPVYMVTRKTAWLVFQILLFALWISPVFYGIITSV